MPNRQPIRPWTCVGPETAHREVVKSAGASVRDQAAIDCIALDLDGTLVEPSTRIVPEARRALEVFTQHGGQFVIASGRPYQVIVDIMQAGGLRGERAPAAIVADEREIFVRRDRQFDGVEPRNDALVTAETNLLRTVRDVLDRVEAVWAAAGIHPKPPDVESENQRGFAERRFSSEAATLQALRILEAHIPFDLPLRPIRNRTLIAVRHSGVGKGTALREVCELLGVPAHRLLAVGDSENDRDMLDGRFGFHCATVANADEAIRDLVSARGGSVASACRGLGVAELVDGLLKP